MGIDFNSQDFENLVDRVDMLRAYFSDAEIAERLVSEGYRAEDLFLVIHFLKVKAGRSVSSNS